MKLALSAGHHNLNGGNDEEIAFVGPITKAIAQHARALGIDTRVITPDDGLGTFDGGLRAVAQTVVTWSKSKPPWTATLFLEIHAEDNSAGDAGRGCFTIYPDWGKDVDVLVRDHVGPALSRAVRAATDIPLRGRGIMSEKQTFVALRHQARLGIFNVTAGLKSTSRAILEVGAYSSPTDRAIMNQDDFADRVGRAIAESLARQFAVDPPLPALPALFVPRLDATLVREGPGKRFPVAWGGAAKLPKGREVVIDQVVPGEQLTLSVGGERITSNQWAHWIEGGQGQGFVWMPLLMPAQVQV